MARWENEGYCPYNDVVGSQQEDTDVRLYGLWSIVGPNVVYEREGNNGCEPDRTCNQIFGADSISYAVLSAVIRKDANADMIKVRQIHNGACNMQSINDIPKVMAEATNPELIIGAASNFAVVLAEASYGLDIYVWDLRKVW